MNHTGSNPPPNPKTNAVAIIPARYDSVRLSGKALLEIAGKPMICWVVERALAAQNINRAIVATDDQRILDVVKSAGYEAVMTSAHHKSGTDRIAEVAAELEDADIVVNVQGDEPLISPLTIERAVEEMGEKGNWRKGEKGNTDTKVASAGIVTTWEPMESPADVLNPDVVKVVVDNSGRAIYFSRLPVPYPREAVRKHGSIEVAILNEPGLLANFRKHTGLYVYRREVLLEFAQWPQSELERLESLEQLRALEHGVKIRAIKASANSIGVDTIADLERVRRLVSSSEFRVSSSLGEVETLGRA
ncbi:MAG TPA: 3-deoxy-manno-octulosonate cytidylyltransferase [Pyrinomonadaceae bacterium]|nr:3-deoxy-manno-octulosonate cytidylyltransferase [Pyrinomonadaceae bacterium]